MARVQKYETKKGDRWMFIIENGIDPQTGNRRRVVKRGFLKQKDAKNAAKEMEYQLGVRNLDTKTNITFQEMAEEWLSVYQLTSRKISTVRVRLHEIGHLNQYFAQYKLKDINKKMYQNMLTDLKNTKQLAHNTISGIHGTARMIFKRAMEQDLIVSDPSQFAFIPKDKKTVEDIENTKVEDKYLEKHELKLFLDAAKEMDEETYAMLFTLAWTGFRAGELVALKWKDIDFVENTINVTKTYYNPKNNTKDYHLLPPKTAGSIRKIIVEDEVIKTLQRQKIRQNEIKLQISQEYYDEDFVFARMNAPYFGYPHFIKTIENRMKAVLKRVPSITKHLTPHSLRHTHTSLLAEAGVELLQIMDRLGHTDDETTTQVYLHITKDRKKEASQKFGELMRNL
ncbi:tyrosine-type recombinase/integrase [Priestia sp. JV24]|uniref:site-specific integrase n=1 Tax=Priestia TaxID=2800373 RepID=UPI0021D66BA5|nr:MULTISPECIES: site-specific integrase [Priestia]MCU7712432.1 tyrosine-type recombinase/integrase [Priestia megaterium]MCW1046261.1 tyrosine-type recombinase/integrase [Priestia sp. JV24]